MPGSPDEVAAVGGVASAPLGESFETPSPLRTQSCRAGTPSDSRVTRLVRGERPERFTYHHWGFANSGVGPRRFTGHSTVVAHSSVSVSRALSQGRPTCKWSRRARRSCAILSPRRAAHLPRYTDKTGRPLDHFSSGLLRLLGVHRGVSLLRDNRAGSGADGRLGVSISGAATSEE